MHSRHSKIFSTQLSGPLADPRGAILFSTNQDQAGLQELKTISQEYRQYTDFEQAAIRAVKKLISQKKPDLAQSWCDELLNNARARAFEPIIKHLPGKVT